MSPPAFAITPPPAVGTAAGRLYRRWDLGTVVGSVSTLIRDAAERAPLQLEDVAGWCAEVGGVDARLEQAALRQARRMIVVELLIADLTAHVRARLTAAGDLLPALIARGGVPRVIALLGLDDVDPPAGALLAPLPPRVARFYWQRLRAYVAWSAACAWT